MLLTRGSINNNVYLYFCTQRPCATEWKQAEYSRLTLFVFTRPGVRGRDDRTTSLWSDLGAGLQ